MKITVLTDNIGSTDLKGEWGLSLYIEYEGGRYLLDTGASDNFITNAGKLGTDLAQVDCAVISHAHYDHSRGLAAFLSVNDRAAVYLSPNAQENCYAGLGFMSKYIGLPKGVIAEYQNRIVRPDGVAQIGEGVWLVPHSTSGLGSLGRRNHLYVKRGFRYLPDDFSHEQTLVFKSAAGLVLLNSCSHSGPEVIVSEVLNAFPGEHIAAYVGGLHLFRLNDSEVRAVADALEACGIDRIYTGHCTGDRAFEILKDRFGDAIKQFYCGMEIELPNQCNR